MVPSSRWLLHSRWRRGDQRMAPGTLPAPAGPPRSHGSSLDSVDSRSPGLSRPDSGVLGTKSSQTNRYRCTFKRWEYDPVFGPKEAAKTYSEGVIKYSAPDKGLFRVDTLLEYQAPKNPGGQPTYGAPEEHTGSYDHWICDGTSVYEFDHRQKKLMQYELAAGSAGAAIGKAPSPSCSMPRPTTSSSGSGCMSSRRATRRANTGWKPSRRRRKTRPIS